MADTESPETDARTTGHAWTEGECVNCRVVSPRPWAEPCAESPRADVELTEALHRAFHEHWAPDKSLDLYPDSPLWQAQAVAVERILADRLAAVQAEAEIAGQMKHITAEMVRGNQPLEAKEEMIADLRARLSHVEAERDGWQARAATNREGWAQMLARAESAEAERDDLRVRLLAVETLFADGPDTPCRTTWRNEFALAGPTECVEVPMDDLRAVLASPSTHTQRDTECRCASSSGGHLCGVCVAQGKGEAEAPEQPECVCPTDDYCPKCHPRWHAKWTSTPESGVRP
jgi:hypothetical protein